MHARRGLAARDRPITPEDHELAVHAIATMIAQWWDANGHQIVHNGNQRLADTDDRTT